MFSRRLSLGSLGFSFVVALACPQSRGQVQTPEGPGVKHVVDVPLVDTVPDLRPDVQIALLLDTSNSMDGLINQARSQLWKIVNEFNATRRDGRPPRVRIALYEYGNTNLPAGEGYLRQVVGFTDDLDKLSESLFALKTNGGSEFCGQVIDSSVRELAWERDPRTYKAIFIAGNEPFTQGQTDYRSAVAGAVGKGIVVNTIHCGSTMTGVQGMWADGAKLGGGEYLWIEQDARITVIKCPQDEIILKLNIELNSTYVPYGERGREGSKNQVAQDVNAASMEEAGASVSRVAAKAAPSYINAGWDLVDARDQQVVKLDELKPGSLPPELEKLTVTELEVKLDQLKTQRADIQKKIAQLNVEREEFLAKQTPKDGNEIETLDDATLKALRIQLQMRGFETKK